MSDWFATGCRAPAGWLRPRLRGGALRVCIRTSPSLLPVRILYSGNCRESTAIDVMAPACPDACDNTVVPVPAPATCTMCSHFLLSAKMPYMLPPAAGSVILSSLPPLVVEFWKVKGRKRAITTFAPFGNFTDAVSVMRSCIGSSSRSSLLRSAWARRSLLAAAICGRVHSLLL